MQRTVDLRSEAPGRVQSAAFYAVKQLAPGEVVVLLTARDPTLMMTSLDLQLRHNLSWRIAEADGRWRVEVRHRDDAPPSDALDVLERDHKRLDGLLVQSMRQLDRNDAAAARSLRAFAAALRRHIGVEDGLLGPALGATGDGPLAIMAREHGEILGQLAVVEECLATADPDAGEASAFMAILSGTLAKHEHREESNLFPLWRARLARVPEIRRLELMEQVGLLLQSDERSENGE
jgi:uncharacterized protein (DUF2249 family)